MDQIHKRFSDDQVKNLFKGYCQRLLDRADVENTLGIGKARFFALLKDHRQNPENFSIVYQRISPSRLTRSAEKEIEKELRLEKSLIEDRELPISSYNYSAVRDRLLKGGIKISLMTIIERAKRLGSRRRRLMSGKSSPPPSGHSSSTTFPSTAGRPMPRKNGS